MSHSVADNNFHFLIQTDHFVRNINGEFYYEKENLISLYEETIFTCYLYILHLHRCLEWNDHCGRLAKGSDYYETKIIVSFETTIIFIYSLFVFIFFSIIFHMKQRFNGCVWIWTTCDNRAKAWFHSQTSHPSRRVAHYYSPLLCK